MDSYYVTEPNAKRLAAQGYKGEFPQMVWCRHYITNKPYLTFWTTSVMNKVGLPAPTHLAALEWLEHEKGYCVQWVLPYLDYGVGRWEVVKPSNKTYVKNQADTEAWYSGRIQTPDELIERILDHLEGSKP